MKLSNINFTITENKAKFRFCAHFCFLFIRKYYNLYHPNDLLFMRNINRYTKIWFATPNDIIKLWNKLWIHCIQSEFDTQNIKLQIDSWIPVIQLVARWYNRLDLETFNIIRWYLCQHYIVILWYNNEWRLCYDSYIDPTWNKKIYIWYDLMYKIIAYAWWWLLSNKSSFICGL